MIEINLSPDVKQELIKAQRVRTKVITISLLVGIVSISTVVLLAINVFAVQSLRNSSADSAINNKSAQLTNISDLPKALTIQNQLNKISSIYDSKKIDSRLFDLLAKIIPPVPNDVQISSLVVDSSSGTISIDGQTKSGFSAFEIFKKTIEGTVIKYTDSNNNKQEVPLVSDMLNIGSTSYGQDSTTGAMVLRFSISFGYSEDIFAVTSKDLSIIVASNGNVTDSYLGVPTSIFDAKAADLTTGGK